MSLDVNSLEIETDEMSSVNRGFDPRETRPSVRRALAWTDLVACVVAPRGTVSCSRNAGRPGVRI